MFFLVVEPIGGGGLTTKKATLFFIKGKNGQNIYQQNDEPIMEVKVEGAIRTLVVRPLIVFFASSLYKTRNGLG